VAFVTEGFREGVEPSGAEMRVISDPPAPPARLGRGPLDLAAIFARMTVAYMPEVVEGLLEEQVDLVVNDSQAPWGRTAAEWLGLPRVCSSPFFPPVRQFEAAKPAEESSPAARAALLASRGELGHRWGVDLTSPLGDFATLADVNLVYSTPEVIGDDEGVLDSSWRLVGPLMEADDGSTTDEDRASPLVYVALGTVYGGQKALFRTVLEALDGLPVRVVVATFGALPPEALAPVPDNATVAARVDSRKLLRGASVHVSHGGASSVHESVLAGVPMVFVPQGSDNPAWATRMTELGAGKIVPESAPEIRAGVERLLDDSDARDATRRLGRRILAHDGASVAVRAIAEVLG
jgi:MGT family glycosyltransferase